MQRLWRTIFECHHLSKIFWYTSLYGIPCKFESSGSCRQEWLLKSGLIIRLNCNDRRKKGNKIKPTICISSSLYKIIGTKSTPMFADIIFNPFIVSPLFLFLEKINFDRQLFLFLLACRQKWWSFKLSSYQRKCRCK